MGSTSRATTSSIYGDTTTKNPYAYSRTNNLGTVSGFQDGTALSSIYNFVNSNVNSLLDEYLNPSLNSTTNKAKLNSFANTLSQQSKENLENDIINSLSKRNMIRSSQASDLYKNLSNQNVVAISNYVNDLLANSQNNTASVLNNLLSYYMQGANYLSNLQGQSLQSSSGNATKTTVSDGGNFSNTMTNRAVNEIIAAALAKL